MIRTNKPHHRSQRSFRSHLAFLLFMMLLLTLTFVRKAAGQEIPPPHSDGRSGNLSLVVENNKTHEALLIMPGRTIKYKTRFSDDLVKGLVTGITDSTIVFNIRNMNGVEIRLENLTLISIPRSDGRVVGGAVLTTYGSLSLISAIGASSETSYFKPSDGEITAVTIAGLVEVFGGLALMSSKRLDIGTTWTLKTGWIGRLRP